MAGLTPSQYLTAFENTTIPIGGPEGLTLAEAELLVSLAERRPGFCEMRHQSVRLAQYCGVVHLGDRVLEILPKFEAATSTDECRDILLRLLGRAGPFVGFRHLSAGQRLRRASLLEGFIAAFFDSVAQILRGGLLRKYSDRDEDISVVRGRILASRQFASHFNRPDRLACQFDELTADNHWNRLIKLGLRSVRPWIVSLELHRRWVELMTAFDEVSNIRVEIRTLDRLVFDRQAVRYQTAISWVRWILSLLSPAVRAGDSDAPALLFDMSLLFQSAVAAVLEQRAGVDPNTEIQEQGSGYYLARVRGTGRRAIPVRPDFIARRRGLVTAVGDAKWKRLEISNSGYLKPSREDLFQMHAYASAYGCQRLTLFYPWHSALAESKQTAFQLTAVGDFSPVVSIACVNVHDDELAIVGGDW